MQDQEAFNRAFTKCLNEGGSQSDAHDAGHQEMWRMAQNVSQQHSARNAISIARLLRHGVPWSTIAEMEVGWRCAIADALLLQEIQAASASARTTAPVGSHLRNAEFA